MVPPLPNFGVLLYLIVHGLTWNEQVRYGNTYERGLFLSGQPRPSFQGVWPQHFQFLVFSLLMPTRFDLNDQIQRVYTWGMGCVSATLLDISQMYRTVCQQ